MYIYIYQLYIFIFLWEISYPELISPRPPQEQQRFETLVAPSNPTTNSSSSSPMWILAQCDPRNNFRLLKSSLVTEGREVVLRGRKSNKERTFEYKQQRARNRNNRVKIGHPVGQQKCLKKRFTAGAAYSLIDICTSHYLYTVYHFHEGFVYCHLLPMWNANESVQCRYSMVQ